MKSKFDEVIRKYIVESLQTGTMTQVPDVEKMKINQKSGSINDKNNSQDTINALIKQIEDLNKKTEEESKQSDIENKKREDEFKKQQAQLQDFQRKMVITQMAPQQNTQSNVQPNDQTLKNPTNFDKILSGFNK
jgi:hypothetical protein